MRVGGYRNDDERKKEKAVLKEDGRFSGCVL